MRFLVLCGGVLPGAIIACATSAAVCFTDDFNRPDGSELGGPAGQPWSTVYQNTSITINGGGLRLGGNGFSGRGFAYQNMANFAGFDSTLSNNSDIITWACNFETSISSPNGYNLHGNAPAFILATTDASYSVGSGYAVIQDDDNDDLLTLARFTDGPDADSHFTPIVTWDTSPIDGMFSVAVTFDPSSGTWELFAEIESAYVDPLSGMTSRGSAVDTTYTTSASGYMGAYWGHNASSKWSKYDNMTVLVGDIPGPGAIALLGLGMLARRRRR